MLPCLGRVLNVLFVMFWFLHGLYDVFVGFFKRFFFFGRVFGRLLPFFLFGGVFSFRLFFGSSQRSSDESR